jgi:PAS domain S-box-containing protein
VTFCGSEIGPIPVALFDTQAETESLAHPSKEPVAKGTFQTRVKDPDADTLSANWSGSLDAGTKSLIEHVHSLESVVEMSPTAILTTDLDANITSWNPAAERLFGYSKAEALGKYVDDLVCQDPKLRAEGQIFDNEVIAGGQVHANTRRTRKDGSSFDVELFASPVYVKSEQVGFVAIYHDITELTREKQYNESLLEVSPAAIASTDMDGNVTSWNPAAERLFGFTSEEAVGRNIDNLVANHPDIHAEAVGVNREAESAGQMHLTTRRNRKDGSLVDVDVLAAMIRVGDKPAGMYAIYHNIGELQRQRRYFEALVLNDPVAVVIVDPDVTVKLWNPAAERLFGYSKEEAIGRNLDDLVAFTEDVRAEALSYSRAVVEGKAVQSITKRNRKDGSQVDVEVSAVVVELANELLGYYAIYHDVTELQRAKRAADAATEAKSAFLATMSHEIRTPMNAVIGMTGLLLDTELTSEQRDYAEIISGSGDALLTIINDILDFSKIEAGKLELELRPFDLRECIEGSLELVAVAASEKGLDLAYELDPQVPSALIGDAPRLRQVLINLLNNAVKFTEQGEVVLSIKVAASLPSRLHFAVRDTGIGIPDDRVGDLFESFSQVDASTTRQYGGTGLGLAISKRLSELMGGSMWVKSRVGEGSTFNFTILADTAPSKARNFEKGAAPRLEGKRILIVDDNATNRRILVQQTASWGMTARETGSPTQALQWIRRGDAFDVAILDMHMPEMDGLMLARQLRQERDAHALPLLMLTSLGQRESALDVDLVAHLTKPIRPSQLYDALLDVFGEQPQRLEDVPSDGDAGGPELAPLRILVAEDNSINQKLIVSLLGKIGYQADLAGNGVEALEALDRRPYDVVLMDVQMPEMDGLDTTRHIHERYSGRARPYIIAATANAMQEERQACFDAGMDDYLSKPIRMDELIAALKRFEPHTTNPSEMDHAIQALQENSDADFVGELINMFLEEAPDLIEIARVAIAAGDAASLQRAAHTLKSNAATFGAVSLENRCRELETKAKMMAIHDTTDLLEQIQAELTTTMVALETRLQEPSDG